MRLLTTSVLLLATACAGSNQSRLAETPTAHSKANTGLAPAASTSDRDREHEVNAFDDMQATQRAHEEAGHAPPAGKVPNRAPKPAPGTPVPVPAETPAPAVPDKK